MICKTCAKAADGLSAGLVVLSECKELHKACKGCDCQHRAEMQAAGNSVRLSERPG